jgi:DNA-binding NarL/FixJ family response regulator
MIGAAMPRVPTSPALSPAQEAVALMLGLGYTYPQIAVELGITERTVRFYAAEAAKRIPGDLPAQQKVVAWVRGAAMEVLDGSLLRSSLAHLAGSGRL